MSEISWGILGPGVIAEKFALALKINGSRLMAVGSRDADRAGAFAKKHGAHLFFGSYSDLLDCRNVDAVYIATPHCTHKDLIIQSLKAGKHVLCEKPMCCSRSEVLEVMEAAEKYNRFVMEAMWTRFLPLYRGIMPLITGGQLIGRPRMLLADYSFACDPNPAGRLLNRELSGGALLDVGVYALNLADMALGEALEVTSVTHMGETGVDIMNSISIKHKDFGVSAITNSINCRGSIFAQILGENGRVELPVFQEGRQARVITYSDDKIFVIEKNFENGFQFEIAEVEECIEDGRVESDIMPLNKTAEIAGIMDKVMGN